MPDERSGRVVADSEVSPLSNPEKQLQILPLRVRMTEAFLVTTAVAIVRPDEAGRRLRANCRRFASITTFRFRKAAADPSSLRSVGMTARWGKERGYRSPVR